MEHQDIIGALKKMVLHGEEVYPVIGTVLTVDAAKKICVVSPLNFPDAHISNVRYAGSQTNGLRYQPKEGSMVVVIMHNQTSGFIGLFSDLDKIEIDCDEIDFNGGANGGLIIISKLQAEVAKLNAFVTALKNTLLSFTPVPGDGASALKVFAGIQLAAVETADLSSVTNDKIKH